MLLGQQLWQSGFYVEVEEARLHIDGIIAMKQLQSDFYNYKVNSF